MKQTPLIPVVFLPAKDIWKIKEKRQQNKNSMENVRKILVTNKNKPVKEGGRAGEFSGDFFFE